MLECTQTFITAVAKCEELGDQEAFRCFMNGFETWAVTMGECIEKFATITGTPSITTTDFDLVDALVRIRHSEWDLKDIATTSPKCVSNCFSLFSRELMKCQPAAPVEKFLCVADVFDIGVECSTDCL